MVSRVKITLKTADKNGVDTMLIINNGVLSRTSTYQRAHSSHVDVLSNHCSRRAGLGHIICRSFQLEYRGNGRISPKTTGTKMQSDGEAVCWYAACQQRFKIAKIHAIETEDF